MSIPINAPFVSPENMHVAQLEFLERKGLSTPEGRTHFLGERLTPLVHKFTQLQEEIERLTTQISSNENKEDIGNLAKTLTEKIEQLEVLVPILKAAGSIHEDLQYLAILFSRMEPIEPRGKEVLDRMIYLYKAIEIVLGKE